MGQYLFRKSCTLFQNSKSTLCEAPMFANLVFLVLLFFVFVATSWFIGVVLVEKHRKQEHGAKVNMKKIYFSLALMLLGCLWLLLSIFVQINNSANKKDSTEPVSTSEFFYQPGACCPLEQSSPDSVLVVSSLSHNEQNALCYLPRT